MSEDEFNKMMQDLLNAGGAELPHGSLCFCGSCMDAIEAAGRIIKQIQDNNECLLWAIQLSAALQIVTLCAIQQGDGVTLESMAMTEANVKSVPRGHLRSMLGSNEALKQIIGEFNAEVAKSGVKGIERIYELASYYRHS